MPTVEEASQVFSKSKQDQLGYLIQSTLRIEKGLATLTNNQESLERIVEQKFYDLDVKVTKIQTAVEQLQEEAEETKGKSTTDAFKRVPRGPRSAAVPVTDTRATTSAPAATAPLPPPAPTPSAPTTSSGAFSSLEFSLHHFPKIKPESHLALCIFELFGNLLPKGEKMYRS